VSRPVKLVALLPVDLEDAWRAGLATDGFVARRMCPLMNLFVGIRAF